MLIQQAKQFGIEILMDMHSLEHKNNFMYQLGNRWGFSLEEYNKIVDLYCGTDRYYHNMEHIIDMLSYMNGNISSEWTKDEILACELAILFHDVVYVPGNKDNELKSYVYCETLCKARNIHVHLLPMIKEMIMATVDHNFSSSLPKYVQLIIRADLDNFTKDFRIVWKNNVNIFKEFQKYDWVDFRTGQIDFLTGLRDRVQSWMPATAYNNIGKVIQTLKIWEPKIAVFAGSFNPFHLGHLDILNKAEKVFDKVIIVRGINQDKDIDKYRDFPAIVLNRQIDYFNGLLTDYLNTKRYSLTVVKGLRDAKDLEYENTTYIYMKDMNPDINVVYFVSDVDKKHISSSAIKKLESMNADTSKYLP